MTGYNVHDLVLEGLDTSGMNPTTKNGRLRTYIAPHVGLQSEDRVRFSDGKVVLNIGTVETNEVSTRAMRESDWWASLRLARKVEPQRGCLSGVCSSSLRWCYKNNSNITERKEHSLPHPQ